jgi:SAM-dependent methyltransferase
VPETRTASFRDPAGRLFRFPDRLVRVVGPAGQQDFDATLASATARRHLASGTLVSADVVPADAFGSLPPDPDLAEAVAGAARVVTHARIAFPSFPYEWPAEMLHAAALLTLDLAEGALAEGLGLKDATPFNVLFSGAAPVFVDWLSFERRDPHDPTWLAYAQFVRTFVLPLLAHREFGVQPGQVFLSQRDGLEPEQVYRMAGASRFIKPSLLAHATLPTLLGRRADQGAGSTTYKPRRMSDAGQAKFVLASLLKRLRRGVLRLAPPAATSSWTGYMTDLHHYSDSDAQRKEAFVSAALAEVAPRRVLDVGCNTGHYSVLSAKAGAGVVAVDGDAAVCGRVWRGAREARLDVLPLVVNIAQPTPATGFLNQECPSFLERASGGFDLVLMLAVLHHILVTERVPLRDALRLAARLTRDAVVIEFVPPADPMFKRIARGREHLHQDLTREAFEAACDECFTIVRREAAEHSSRTMYLLRRRA